MNKEMKIFIITYIKCFFLLIFLGEILPRIIEWMLNLYYSNPELHKNSILVGGEVNGSLQWIYNYKKIFRMFLR